MSYLEPQVVSIDLPREAKTPATAFRWWQPQHGMQCHAKNSLNAFIQPKHECFSTWACAAETSGYQKYIVVNSLDVISACLGFLWSCYRHNFLL